MTILSATTQRKLFFDAIGRGWRWWSRVSSGLSAASRNGWLKALGLVSGVEVFAFADQAVVSATSFFTTVMVGRYSNPAELGAYAIGISVLAAMYTIQGSLISLPYSIQGFGLGSWLALQVLARLRSCGRAYLQNCENRIYPPYTWNSPMKIP